jgi:hypothetical protein
LVVPIPPINIPVKKGVEEHEPFSELIFTAPIQ